MICASAEVDNLASISKISQQVHLAPSTVWKVLKEEKYFAYKMNVHQKIYEHDRVIRSHYCEEMLHRFNADPGMLQRICFADEATVQLYGTPNHQNVRRWSSVNEHLVREARTQYPQKLNLYAAVCNGALLGPYIIEGNLNGGTYLNMLQNQVGEAFNIAEQNVCNESFKVNNI